MMKLKTSICAGWIFSVAVGALSMSGALCAEPSISPEDLPRTPPTEPQETLSTFQLRPGIRLELVAAEPLVADPIAMCFDEDSRLFVVEMIDYSERRDERLGRIRMLEDTDEDGVMDKSTVFAEDLPWPTALIWYKGGLFVGASPDILYLKDENGDGKADQRQVIFTGFGSTGRRLNVQALLNSFTWGLDNRIHGANGGNGGTIRNLANPKQPPLELGSSDFSFDPRTFEIRRENGGGQYGLTFDSAGRKFICSNSAHIRQVMYDYASVLPDMAYPLPPPAVDIPVDGANAAVYRISPEEPWRVIRTKWRVAGLVSGPIEGGGRASGYFTSATGITIYRGAALGLDFLDDAFIADVGSNLIHRKKLRFNGVPFEAYRVEDERKSEFIASRDLWFRPVAFANAPDGALYIADMYREVIEHPWSIPENMKKLIDLNSGNDRGRIYRVVPDSFQQAPLPKLSKYSRADLLLALFHPNGWHRDTAARLLFEQNDKYSVPALRQRLNHIGYGRVHALHLLNSFGALTSADLINALESNLAELRESAARLLPAFAEKTAEQDQLPGVLSAASKLADDPFPRVRYQLAWALASLEVTNKAELFRRLIDSARDAWESHAIYAAVSREPSLRKEFPQAFSRKLAQTPTQTPRPLVLPATSESRDEAARRFTAALDLKGDPAKGLAIYTERCASCHRLSNQGNTVGPDLESVRAAGRETTLINILDPNRQVQPSYATYEIITSDDEMVTGVLANDAPNGLTIRQAGGLETFVPRAAIKSARTTSSSLMPEGLEAGLSPQEMADLLACIEGE